MFWTKNKQTRGGSRIPTSSMMELFVTIYCQEVISYWQNSSNLDDVAIGDLPLYAIIFSFHDKSGSMEEEKTQRTQAFHILVPSFFSQCERCNLLFLLFEKRLFFDRSICILGFFPSFIWTNIHVLEIFE